MERFKFGLGTDIGKSRTCSNNAYMLPLGMRGSLVMTSTDKIKLTGGLEKTVTWIWLENSYLFVEYYDFSDSAQRMFGNDIAYTLTVTEMSKLYFLSKQEETSLISWLVESFKDYFGIERWLKENGIDFSVERESWA